MFRPATLLLVPLLLGAAPAPPEPSLLDPQMTILHQRITFRVPRMTVAAARAAPPRWKERKGPRCIQPEDLAGAVVAAPAVVDLLMVDGSRMRAKLDHDCRSADFYSGLYLKPGADGRVCADRDAFRVRSGARCEIDDFRRLALRR